MGDKLVWNEAGGLPELVRIKSLPSHDDVSRVWEQFQEGLDDSARVAHMHGGAMLSLDDVHIETLNGDTTPSVGWGLHHEGDADWPMAG